MHGRGESNPLIDNSKWTCDQCGVVDTEHWMIFHTKASRLLCDNCYKNYQSFEIETGKKAEGDIEIEVEAKKWEDFFGVTKERESVLQSRVDLLENQLKADQLFRERQRILDLKYQQKYAGG